MYVCESDLGHSLLQQGKDMDSPLQKWLLAVLKRMLGVRDTTPSWCVAHARVWIGTFTVQLVLRGDATGCTILD